MHAEKAFHKIQLLFIIKTLSKLGIEGNLIKGISEKPTASNVMIKDNFSPHFYSILMVLASVIRQEKTNEGQSKISLLTDNITIYTENLGEHHQSYTISRWVE